MIVAGRQPVIRLAGLPVSVFARLRFRTTADLVERLVSEREWLGAEGDALASALYEVIGNTGRGTERSRLVGLRRALHNASLPAPTERRAATSTDVPPDVAQRIHRWMSRLHAWRQDRARLPQALADETASKEDALRHIAANPAFRRAILDSSPVFADELDKWLGDRLRRLRRQSLFRLAKYVSRAAAKTSPTSAFAVSGLGTWVNIGPSLRIASEPELRGVLQLEGQLQDKVIDALLHRDELWKAVAIRSNPSVTDGHGRVMFLGRPPAERLQSLPTTAAVQECLEAINAGNATTLGDLQEYFTSISSAPASEVIRFIDHLVDAGVLELMPPTSGDARCWDEIGSWTATYGGAELADVAGALSQLAQELTARVPVEDVPGFRAQRDAIQHTVRVLSSLLQIDRNATDPNRRIVHDSVVGVGIVGSLESTGWQPALHDLDLIRRWLSIFNRSLPLKLALAEIWRAQFGEGASIPFLTWHGAVRREASAGTTRGAELRSLLLGGPFGKFPGRSEFSGINKLWRLHGQALKPMLEQQANAVDPIEVDPEHLAELATNLPSWVDSISSLGCYVQPRVSGHDIGLVLNAAHAGPGRGWNRVAHLLALAGQQPQTDVLPTTDPVLAELAGPNGSTINDRVASVPYEIDYPFTHSGRPQAHRLPLSDLVVVKDAHSGILRLHSRRLEREVRALDLGLLMVTALPPAARLLVLGFGDSPPMNTTPGFEEAPPPPDIRKLPRITAGRVVLRRARWVLHAGTAPIRGHGEADADYLLRLTEWLRSTGIPPRSFVRAQPAAGDKAITLMVDKARKPMYIDFHNWFLVLAFENMLRASGTEVLVFEEALPDPVTVSEPASDPRAVEFLIELCDQGDNCAVA